MLLIKNKPLYTKVATSILQRVLSKEFNDTLPSEEQLAKILGVSKNTTREALAELTTQGLICKKHGVGNVIMYSALNLKYRIDVNLDFMNILQQMGYKTKMVHSYSSIQEISLDFLPKDNYYFYNEFMMANDTPACVTTSYIPASFFNEVFPPKDLPKPNMFEFIAAYTNENIAHSSVYFEAKEADEFLAKSFKLALNTPLLTWREVFYTVNDKPICYTRIYFHPEYFKPTMIRKGFALDEMQKNPVCKVVKDIAEII
ncbi:MAG: GntR family transcriptional regulator [Clostridia bacterium]